MMSPKPGINAMLIKNRNEVISVNYIIKEF